ncbi:MAG: hypothetical protein OXC26_15765 [Albidovulum sp.]|nr:hypothetical protein [Albidovulum sp.]
MNEDARRNREVRCAENLALMRRLALNIARAAPGKDSMRRKPRKADWRNEFLVEPLRAAARLPHAVT